MKQKKASFTFTGFPNTLQNKKKIRQLTGLLIPGRGGDVKEENDTVEQGLILKIRRIVCINPNNILRYLNLMYV